MQLTLDAEQLELQKTVRSFLDRRSPESAVRAAMSSSPAWDPELWKGMAEQGLQGLAVPERLGGGGFGYVELSVVAGELGRALACVPFLASVGLATELLLASADEAAQSELVPRLATGETVGTVALLDDSRTWDASGLAATARRDGERWRLHGAKRFVLAADVADLLLVVAATDEGPSVFAVDADATGVTRKAADSLDLTRPLGEVHFDAAPARLVGAPGSAPEAVERMLAVAQVLLAWEQVGGAERALEMAVEHARTRIQFGRPIGTFQAIKHTCADMLAEVEGARATAQYAAWVLQSAGADLPVAASLATAKCSQAYVDVAQDTIQVHGGIGFTWEHPAHLYLKRARADYLLLGTPAQHRRRLAGLIGV